MGYFLTTNVFKTFEEELTYQKFIRNSKTVIDVLIFFEF